MQGPLVEIKTVASGQWPVRPKGGRWRCEKSNETKPIARVLVIGGPPFTTSDGGIERANKPDFRPVARHSGERRVECQKVADPFRSFRFLILILIEILFLILVGILVIRIRTKSTRQRGVASPNPTRNHSLLHNLTPHPALAHRPSLAAANRHGHVPPREVGGTRVKPDRRMKRPWTTVARVLR